MSIIKAIKELFNTDEPHWVIIEPQTGWWINRKDQAAFNRFCKWRDIVSEVKLYTEKFDNEEEAKAFVRRLKNFCILGRKYNVYVVPDSQYKKLVFDFKDGLTDKQIEEAMVIPSDERLQKNTAPPSKEGPLNQEGKYETD